MRYESRFPFDPQLLTDCVSSSLATFVSNPEKDANRGDETKDRSCLELFTLHADHFQHSSKNQFRMVDTNPPTYKLGSRLDNFVRNCIFVYNHDSQKEGFEVTLNRFSHRDLGTVLPSAPEQAVEYAGDSDAQSVSVESRNEMLDTALDFDVILSSTQEHVVNLTPDRWGVGHGAFNKLNPKLHKRKKLYAELADTHVDIPMDQQQRFEAAFTESPETNGALVSIKRNHEYHRHNSKRQNSLDSLELTDALTAGSFDEQLNWATSCNPDGIPIVNEPFDQGGCGACWAFAAAGSVEASAARREAYLTYTAAMSDGPVNKTTTNMTEWGMSAIEQAQQKEWNAFNMLNLSIQELIDCDVAVNQGCTGGNPLLAFYFIHRYGLTTWDRYPYSGTQDMCQRLTARQPIASVRSWGVLAPNHESNMQLALRFVGPISVGINGGDPSFLSYSGGIYNKTHCKQGANHALLIVGYGQETKEDGSVDRYWIARNSWGKGWGESGYARIARRSGHKGVPGVCGVARSPSVALGGFLLDSQALRSRTSDGVETLEYSPIERICIFLGSDIEGSCGRLSDWVDTHHAHLVGAIGILLAMLSVWPLSSDWRRRRRRRRQRQQRLCNQTAGSPAIAGGDPEVGESDPLLTGTANGQYGGTS